MRYVGQIFSFVAVSGDKCGGGRAELWHVVQTYRVIAQKQSGTENLVLYTIRVICEVGANEASCAD